MPRSRGCGRDHGRSSPCRRPTRPHRHRRAHGSGARAARPRGGTRRPRPLSRRALHRSRRTARSAGCSLAARAGRGAEVGWHPRVRREGLRPGAGSWRAALGHQSRAALPHRRRLALRWSPALVGLFCLESAEEGGLSRFVSLVTAHERLRARHPDLLDRLYQPFWWDRQAEHAPGDPPVSGHPVFEVDGGGLAARYYEDYVVKGHALSGEPLDATGTAALAALREIVDAPAHWVEFRIEKGQFQYLNNRRFAHSRTALRRRPRRPPASHAAVLEPRGRDDPARRPVTGGRDLRP